MSNSRPLFLAISRPVLGVANSNAMTSALKPLAQRILLPAIVRGGLLRQSRTYIPTTCLRPLPQRTVFQPVWKSPLYPIRVAAQKQRSFGTNGVSRSLLATREATANRNPNSATAQNAFYQLLLKANMPSIVVERYQSGLYASNDAADSAYFRALDMMKQAPAPGANAAAGEQDGAILRAASQAAAARITGKNVTVSTGSVSGTGASQEPLYVVVNEGRGTIIFRWVKTIMYFVLIGYISIVFVSLAVGFFDNMDVYKRGSKSSKGEVRAETQKTRFSDVHGCDEAKEELQEVVEFLRNPERFSSLGGKLPRGVLLVGPPGTGKTLLARAIAGESGVPFFYMSGSEFDEIFVGVGAKRVRELFTAAKQKSPSIIFIDELDAIGGKRSARDAAYMKQTLNQLLTELDGFDKDTGVIVIAATNHPQLLDKALTRPGRFDRHVVVDLPDVRGRLAILGHHAKKIKLEKNVTLEAIAARSSGLSGAELENIVNQAAVHASKAKAAFVGMKDLEWAMDKIIMGTERRMVIQPKEKLMTAYHEAGHALVLLYAEKPPSDLHKVTILARGQSLGHTAFVPEMDKYSYTLSDFVTNIRVAMGGKVAEELVFGPDQITSGVSADLKSATRQAFAVVSRFGMSQKLAPMDYANNYERLSSETRAMVEAEVQRMLNQSAQEVKVLLTKKRKELDLLAQALVQFETLDKAEVEKVIRGEKLPGRIPLSPDAPMTVPVLEGPSPLVEGITGPPSEPTPPAPAPPPAVP